MGNLFMQFYPHKTPLQALLLLFLGRNFDSEDETQYKDTICKIILQKIDN